MTMVNRLKATTLLLGAAAGIMSALVWGDSSNPKTTPTGGLNPVGVKLSDDLMTNRFAKQPVVTYETTTGETFFALQVKPNLKAAPARPRDYVLVVDTSASQTGRFLESARRIVNQIVQDAAGNDRISLWVINTPTATRSLSGGLRFPNEVAKKFDVLQEEYASGAVDLKGGIERTLKDFDGKVSRQQAIIYIGDAESAYAQLSEKDRYELAGKIRDAKVQFFAVPLGATINGLNMHSLVSGTGGSVVRFSDEIKDPAKSAINVATRLREAMLVPVMNATIVSFGSEVAEFYPTRLPPLRSDAATLVVGKFKGKAPAKLEATIEGRVGTVETKVAVSELVPISVVENFFLTTIVRQWSESKLKDSPAILRADRTLALAFEQGRLTRDEYLTQAEWALGSNQFQTAKNLSEAATKLDPGNSEVKALRKIIDKLDKGELTLEGLKIATNNRIGVNFKKLPDGTLARERVNLQDIAAQDVPAAKDAPAVPVGDPNALLKAEQARKAILEQQINLTVQETLVRGRELLRGGDPKAAKDLILAQRDSIKANPDIGEALRAQLINRMELLMSDIGQRGEQILRDRAEESERIARARAKLMQAETQQAREERTRERVKAFTNLMAQARHEDAYREALYMMQEHVNDARPIPIETQAVYQMGQASTNLREMRELTRIREDRFLLTMMQVEKSHIPYPDEPPVHFPPSKVWKDLLELRKRYASSDFEGDMKPQARKRMEFLKSALENPVSEIEKGDVALPFLLETVAALASPPGAERDPSRKVTILLDVDAFQREKMGMFDPEKVQIKFPSKLVGVSLATVLRLICEQIDGTYWVRRDYIEIVPSDMAIREKVIRVFPVEDLIIGIPNGINTSALSQSLQVLGASFSLGGGPAGAPVVFNGNQGGFGAAGGAGGAGGFAAAGAGGVFNGGGVGGFAGQFQGNVGANLGGQFGFQGQDYGPILVQLITEVVAKGEWTISQNQVIGGGGAGMVDPPMDVAQLPPEKLNRLGYWPPARALIVTGTSRFHRSNSSKLVPKAAAAPVNFIPKDQAKAGGGIGGGIGDVIAKVDPKPKFAPLDPKMDQTIAEIIKKEPNLDPEKVYQLVLAKGMTDAGEIIACVDFMVKCRQFKHAAELLKAGLRTGVIAEPWAQEALAIALEGSQGSKEEIERARVSSIDLAPKSPLAYIKASKAMADLGDPDRAIKFCKEAARLEPNMADPYVNALVYAGHDKATPDSDIAAWAGGNLLAHDWTTDTKEHHLRAREFLKSQAVKFATSNKAADAQKLQAVLDNETRRDVVIQLLWSGGADLDLKVREPIGTTCSSLEKQTSGGGILFCDDFTQKDDAHSETYTASESFNGSFQVSVDRVWGRSLGNKATLKIIKHQGTPRQTVELVTLDLTKQTTHTFNFEGGRRTSMASVPPPGAVLNTENKPDRENDVMAKLKAMSNGTSNVMVGMGGGIGNANKATPRDERDAPLVEVTQQTGVGALAPGGLELRHQTTLSKDGRKLHLKMAPVFQTGAAPQGKLKLDFIPGAE